MHLYEKQVKRSQERFRNESETISEAARAPSDEAGRRHGYLLSVGYEQENLFPSLRQGRALRFFESRAIKWWRSQAGGDPDKDEAGNKRPSGPTRNMASSQIACVNVLMPLAYAGTALTAILRTIDPDVEGIEPISYRRAGQSVQSSLVEFEWVGEGRSLEGTIGTRGANTTSADAFLIARMKSGRRKGFLMEWKLIEQYRHASSQLAGTAGITRRTRYATPYATSGAFTPDRIPLDAIAFDPIWQLMRMTLLGDLMVRRSATSRCECEVEETTVVVVCPSENDAYYGSVAGSLAALADTAGIASHTRLEAACSSVWAPGRLEFTTPRQIVQAVRESDEHELPFGWSDYLRERYEW